MTGLLITHAQIFDGTGSAPFAGEVLVDGQTIAEVAPAESRIDRGRATEVLDAQGATLMPGLIEPHAHLTFTSAVDRISFNMMPSVEEHVLITAHNAKTLLDFGYTSAFSGGATRPAVEVKLRDEVAAGFIPGPRIKAASFERNVDGERIGYGRGADEMRTFCNEMIGLGVDSMKLILSGARSVIPQHFDELTYSEDELSVASSMAHAAGVNLLGHAYSSESIQLAIRHGFHAIYHCNFADEATLDLMEEHKDRFFVVPAVGIIVAGLTRLDEASPQALERKPEAQDGLKRIYDAQLQVIPKMHERGIRVLPGGDYGFAHNPHGRNAWDIELLVSQFGFSPAEALAAATRDGGAIMGMSDRLGLVKEGYLADLLLVDGNPLDDVRILQDRDRLLMIMKEGTFHKEPRLLASSR